MERADMNAAIHEAMIGKVMAFIFVLTALGVSAYALYLGLEWFAAIFGGATIASVVAAFVASNRKTNT